MVYRQILQIKTHLVFLLKFIRNYLQTLSYKPLFFIKNYHDLSYNILLNKHIK